MISRKPTSLHTEQKIDFIKTRFQKNLSKNLNLHFISAPLFVNAQSGFQDSLSGAESAVSFSVKEIPNTTFEIVHSLAKWKRWALASFEIPNREGIITRMHTLRPDEESLDTGIHSIFVDQWDWEQVISSSERTLKKLKFTVQQIYAALYLTASELSKKFDIKTPLAEKITFIHAEELRQLFPDKSAKERENLICKKYGTVFIIGIGHKLSDNIKHDDRAPDYDDWSTLNEEGFHGLNGDLLVWHPILRRAFELSSMGIRVTPLVLQKQLDLCKKSHHAKLPWHQLLLKEKLPLSIGGGIGQSRLCQFLLQCKHIGEVQPSAWPTHIIQKCEREQITLL